MKKLGLVPGVWNAQLFGFKTRNHNTSMDVGIVAADGSWGIEFTVDSKYKDYDSTQDIPATIFNWKLTSKGAPGRQQMENILRQCGE